MQKSHRSEGIADPPPLKTRIPTKRKELNLGRTVPMQKGTSTEKIVTAYQGVTGRACQYTGAKKKEGAGEKEGKRVKETSTRRTMAGGKGVVSCRKDYKIGGRSGAF